MLQPGVLHYELAMQFGGIARGARKLVAAEGKYGRGAASEA